VEQFNDVLGKFWYLFGVPIAVAYGIAGSYKSFWGIMGTSAATVGLLAMSIWTSVRTKKNYKEALALADDIWDLFTDSAENQPMYHFEDLVSYYECRPDLSLFYRLEYVMEVDGDIPAKAVTARFGVVNEAAPLVSIKKHLRVCMNDMPINDIRVKDEGNRFKKWAAVLPEQIEPGKKAKISHELRWPGGWDTLRLRDYTDHVSFTPIRETKALKIVVSFPAEIPFEEIACSPNREEGAFSKKPTLGGTLVEWVIENPEVKSKYNINIGLTHPCE
jgi:hypothetical protein